MEEQKSIYTEYIDNIKHNLSKINLEFNEIKSIDCKVALLVNRERTQVAINEYTKSISVCMSPFSIDNFINVLNDALAQIISWNRQRNIMQIIKHQFLFCLVSESSLKFGLMELKITTNISVVYLNIYEDYYGWRNLMQYLEFDNIKNEFKHQGLYCNAIQAFRPLGKIEKLIQFFDMFIIKFNQKSNHIQFGQQKRAFCFPISAEDFLLRIFHQIDFSYLNKIFVHNSSFSEIHWQREFYYYAKLCTPNSMIVVPEFSINGSLIDFMIICNEYRIKWAFELCMDSFEEHFKRFFYNGSYCKLIIDGCLCNLVYLRDNLNNCQQDINIVLNDLLDEINNTQDQYQQTFLDKFTENFFVFQIIYNLKLNSFQIQKIHLKIIENKFFFEKYFIFQCDKQSPIIQ